MGADDDDFDEFLKMSTSVSTTGANLTVESMAHALALATTPRRPSHPIVLDRLQAFDLWFYTQPECRHWRYRIPWLGSRLLEREYRRVRATWVQMGTPVVSL